MLNKCWKRLAVVLAVGTVLAVGLVGCNEAEVPEAEVIESEVVSETVSEEVSEEVTSEAESESVEEENGGVEYVNFNDKYELMAYLKGLKKTIVIDYDFSKGTEQAIISNGGKYTLKDDNNMLSVISTNKTITDIESHNKYFYAQEPVTDDGRWSIFIQTTGADLEVSFTVMYDDGTSEDFTIYVTLGEDAAEGIGQASTSEVETVQFSNVDELVAYLTGLNKTSIVEFNFSVDENSQSIIPNGAKYTMQRGERLHVVSAKEVESVDANVDNIVIIEPFIENVWAVGVYNSGTDMEVSFTVNYKDGTSEDFTIYVTVDEVM